MRDSKLIVRLIKAPLRPLSGFIERLTSCVQKGKIYYLLITGLKKHSIICEKFHP